MKGKLMSKFIFVMMVGLLPGLVAAGTWQNGWEGGAIDEFRY